MSEVKYTYGLEPIKITVPRFSSPIAFRFAWGIYHKLSDSYFYLHSYLLVWQVMTQ